VLEIELNEPTGGTSGAGGEWGQIALVVRAHD
jgi:hypothetical protein